ncbi:5-oxoprolinase subunit PxpA [Pasteurellaceae bacterium LIM206]|nr:5-oxoprolinase subunit PxpA [Pasteurellaceae bacterium LIM206]
MNRIDLNADLAEGFPYDHDLLKRLSSANIACGLHAGNAVEMDNAVRRALENNVRIGAHPGFPDRKNFGRTAMSLPYEELRAYLHYQLGSLQAICRAHGTSIVYVKPHGALYNQAAKDSQLAQCIIRCIREFDPQLKVMGLSSSLFLQLAEQAGLATISEVFADRHYQADGSLVPRSQANAIIDDDNKAIAQVLQMIRQGTVTAIDGSTVVVKADSLCLHGDNQKALEFAERITNALTQQHIQITN